MGVTFFWLALRIPPEHASSIAAQFAQAVAASAVPPTAHRVLKRGDVGQLIPALDAVLEGPSPEMLARTRRWLDRGNNQSIRPEELFAFIPRALRAAQARRDGLLVLTARG